MPFVTSAFYFMFVLLYYAETQKQASIQRERNMLDTQLRQAQTEFASLRQMQQNAATYRHDMRHHLALLQGLASKGLPVSKEQGHGYGTKSMAHIVEKHGGVFQFSVKDGWFIFLTFISFDSNETK